MIILAMPCCSSKRFMGITGARSMRAALLNCLPYSKYSVHWNDIHRFSDALASRCYDHAVDRCDIDSYSEAVIDKVEFEPRIAGLNRRVSQLEDRQQAALELANSERDLALVISCLEDFSAKVTTGLDNPDRLGMQDIIRTVVR